MQRDTFTFNVGDHTIAAKTYATAREANAIQQAYFRGSKVELVGNEPKISELNPGVQFEVKRELIAQLVTVLDGSGDNIVDRCCDLPVEQFDEIVGKLDEIAAKKKK